MINSDSIKISIFTPTFNRAYILENLYNSLVLQIYTNFEWLIVDDGSTDNTEKLVEKFINERKLDIKYIKQKNGGKHRAINRGLQEARGELFFIVDSDDTLPSISLERVLFYYEQIRFDKRFAGVVGHRGYPNGGVIGNGMKQMYLDSDILGRRYVYDIQGDMAKVLRTNIFKQFLFPEIDGENFVGESLVWNKMALHYKFRYFNEIIYYTTYREDGLTFNSVKNRRKNKEYTHLLYKELSEIQTVPLKYRFKAMINLWRFALCNNLILTRVFFKIKNNPILIFALPMGVLLYLKDCFTLKSK